MHKWQNILVCVVTLGNIWFDNDYEGDYDYTRSFCQISAKYNQQIVLVLIQLCYENLLSQREDDNKLVVADI